MTNQEQYEKMCDKIDKIKGFPVIQWIKLDKINDDKLKDLLYFLSREYPEGNSYIFYGRQKHSESDEWDYYTVLAEVKEHENHCCKYDVTWDWDYDEGESFRQWLGYADIMELEEYDAGAEYEELEKRGKV